MKLKKELSLLLVLCIVLSLMPMTVFAEESYSITAQSNDSGTEPNVISTWFDLQAAISAAADGDIITLTGDLTAEHGDTMISFPAGRNVTLDLGGHTLDRNLTSAHNDGHVIYIPTDATAAIQNGTLTGGYANNGGGINNRGTLTLQDVTITENHVAEENNNYRGAGIYNGGTLTMTGGTITGNSGNDGGGIFNAEEKTVTLNGVTITGNESLNHGGGGVLNYGTFRMTDCTVTNNTSQSDGAGIWTNSDLQISGGTISGNISSGRGGGIYVGAGSLHLIGAAISDNQSTDGGGMYVVSGATVISTNDTSITGNTATTHGGGGITDYGSLQITDTLTVTGNTSIGSGGGIWVGGSFEAEGTIVIKDNQGYETNDNLFLRNGSYLVASGTISNSSEIYVSAQSLPCRIAQSSNGYVDGTAGIFISDISGYTVMFMDEDIYLSASASYINRSWDDTDKKVISEPMVMGVATSVANAGTVSNDVITLSNAWYYADVNTTWTNRVVINGTVHLVLGDDVTFTCSKGIRLTAGNTLYIHGQEKDNGKLIINNVDSYKAAIGTDDQDDGNNDNAGTLIVHGGMVTVTGGTDSAGIGGGNEANGGTVTIFGGTVTATGGDYGAGIGSGDEASSAGSYTQYGGEVTANGGEEAAGIGGGNEVPGGTVTIWGGSLTATGKSSKDFSGEPVAGGAGIGGGDDENGGTVTIHGGTVTAFGGKRAGAGIGGGENGNGGIVSINGGTIIARGGYYSAGIGGGENGNGGTITINDGNVTATSGDDPSIYGYGMSGAGIGGGDGGKAGKITINGGTVYTIGGAWAPGIGTGDGADLGVDLTYNTGSITITGGDVTAIGGNRSAGIGGGYKAGGVTITISGGTITASTSDKSDGGAGIGSGYGCGLNAMVTISGGIVNAYGGRGAADSGSTHGGAGIGTGVNGNEENNNTGKIIITDGTVNAYGGRGAAGIGGGYEAPAGTIEISGGTVLAVSQKITKSVNNSALALVVAPGIGSGAECDENYGSVKISGGAVTATSSGNPGGSDTYAIGIGQGCVAGNLSANFLTLEPDMSVTKNDGTTPVAAADRIPSCMKGTNTASIAVCTHPDSTYIITDETHTLQCAYCLSVFTPEAHTPDHTQVCTICGQGTLYVTFDANGGNGTMAPVGVAPGTEYTLPACGFTAPDDMKFKGWQVSAEIMQPGQNITVTEDITVTALWGELHTINILAYDSCSIELSTNAAIEGELVTVTITPYTGCELQSFVVRNISADILIPYNVDPEMPTLYTFTMPDADVNIIAVCAEMLGPKFTNHSLLLSGEIGVRFRVSFPEDFDPTDCYVDFVASDGRHSTMTYEEAETIEGSTDRCFSFDINVLELAEEITATLHYGESRILVDTYSAMTYIQYVQQNLTDRQQLLDLVNALHAYGYYMQASGWTDDKASHMPIPLPATELTQDDIVATSSAVAGYGVSKNFGISGIIDSKFSLTLNAKTVINISVKPGEGVTITSPGYRIRKINGETYYQFTTDKIGPKNLGTDYVVTIATNQGTATVTASAMAYVKAALDSDTLTETQRLAMAAYYYYFVAADQYGSN